MATGLVAVDAAAVTRGRGVFADPTRGRFDAMRIPVQSRLTPEDVDVPGVARLELSTGCGKTAAAMNFVQYFGRIDRRLLIVAPRVIETIEVARRLRIVVTTSMLSHGVDVDGLVRRGQALIFPRTTGQLRRPSTYAVLQRVAPEMFAVARRERRTASMDGGDMPAVGRMHRRIRRLLAGLDVHAGSLTGLLGVAIRWLLRYGRTLVGRAASTGEYAQPDVAFGVPIPDRPQSTRGPTAPWTTRILSVHGKPVYP